MSSTNRRVMIVGADGLRPDLVDPELMPTYARLMAQGTRFAEHHAVYPTHTRVNMSSLTTGCAPGKHGVVANVMRVAGATPDGIIDTSNYGHLQALEGAECGPAILVPSLGEMLDAHDARVAVAATSSPGAGILWSRNHPYRMVNTNTAYDRADLYSLRAKLGELPPAGMEHRLERQRYAARAVTDIFLDDVESRLVVLWMNEPDSSLHYYGLGSPETHDAMRACDDALAHILDGMDRRGIRDQFDIFLISDHGHSTVKHHRSLAEYIDRAGIDLGNRLELTTSSDFVYASSLNGAQPSAKDLEPFVRWLQEQPWAGVVLGGTPEIASLSGVLPLSAAWNGHLNDRAPLLAVSPAWTDEINDHGVPGAVAALTEHVALRSTHGSVSPYDLHALAVAIGPSFQEGVINETPTGAIDIAPTMLTLLGITPPEHMDGRVVWEAMSDPQGDIQHGQTEVITPENEHPDRFNPELVLHRVGSTSYVHQGTNGNT
ncbi:MAG: alkaline phosphatase family protein [Chloroflexia bacterium]|nr:alkaline phosphatase family protein [Chloroflexia bacterium]